jgi:uncharacterized protein
MDMTMNMGGACKIMKIYVSENSMYHGHNLYHALVLKLREIGMAGVTVTRGVEGYGQGRHLHTARLVDLSFEMPIILEVIDHPDRIAAALPVVEEMVNEGLILVSDVHVVKYGKTIADNV